MFLRQWLASVVKELRLLAHDVHGLAILFVMPLAFVVIMSLALQDFMGDGSRALLDLVVLDEDGGSLAREIAQGLAAVDNLQVETRAAPAADGIAVPSPAQTRLRDQVRRGEVSFALLLPPRMSARHARLVAEGDLKRLMDAAPADRIPLTLIADPGLRADALMLLQGAVERVVARVEMRRLYSRFAGGGSLDADAQGGLLIVDNPTQASAIGMAEPTSTQQNVPAYALLAIFMMVVPLSGAFIKERAQGTLARLRSMPVSGSVILLGKVVPWFIINMVQLAMCLLVGRHLLPWLGAPALAMGSSPGAVVLLGAATSLAAIGFALLVALHARTIEQATAFGAASVLVLAALGGVMVPRMMMPATLQELAGWSPLGWALDGFLALFVRGAGVVEIWPQVLALLAFAAVCLAFASWRYARLARSV